MSRSGLALVLLATFLLPAAGSTAGQANCAFRGAFAQLQSQIPDRVGACLADEQDRPDLGQSTQSTTHGTLVWHSVDEVVSFSDGAQTWVLDPNAQVQARGVNERFPWEFNGDGLPLVGQPAPNTNGPCPSPAVPVLVIENFYASLVQQLGGQCVVVTTILSDPDADPHEFQPSANDIRAFQTTTLVVENGLGYDDFADKAIATLSQPPVVVRAGDVLGLEVGANPHVWYSAGYVDQIKAAMLAGLKQVNPDASSYFDAQAAALEQAFGTYRQLIGAIAGEFNQTPVGSTESIFIDMAQSTALNLITPLEFMTAISEGQDPSARDIARFQDQLSGRQVKVLVYNVQTATSTTDQLKALAVQNGIPIVGVSETMPPGDQTFQGWQARQLQLLLTALRIAAGH